MENSSAVANQHLVDGYGSTEAGGVFVDGHVRRPPVIDYKLVDVPDLGYFHTDQPGLQSYEIPRDFIIDGRNDIVARQGDLAGVVNAE